MKTYYYKTQQLLPEDIFMVWDFFSSPSNLALITPPEMRFKVLSNDAGEEIYEGMIIDYLVSPLFGIPLKWQTWIRDIDKPYSFTDIQKKGPYRLWQHTHIFIQEENAVLMKDEIKYQLPFGWLGTLAQPIVRRKLEHIFNFRKSVISRIFSDNVPPKGTS